MDLGAACAAAAAVSGHEQDDAAEDARPGYVEGVAGREGGEPVAEPLADRLAAAERAARDERVGAHLELHVLRVEGHRVLEVAVVRRRELVEDDVDVALRHPWRPRPGRYWLSAARTDCLHDLVVASTAVGSYPQCAMQLAQRGSRPRPSFSHSVVSTSSW